MRPSSATAFDADPDVGARIRDHRERLGLSQLQLAEAVGVERRTIYAWETGRSGATWEKLRALAAALGCEERAILGLGNTNNGNPGDPVRPGEQLDAVLEALKAEQTALREQLAALAEEIQYLRAERVVRDAASQRRTEASDHATPGIPPEQQP